MANRETNIWRLQIAGCVLALGISFCPAHASQDAQNQPPQNQAAQQQYVPATPSTVSPNTAPSYETSTSWPSAQATASSPTTAPAKTIFRVKYISEGAIYLDAGRNEGLDEGMLLHLVHADPSGGTTEAVRFQGGQPIADVRVFSVADTSSAAEIIKAREDLVDGDIAYLDNESVRVREDKVNAAESENYPVVVTFSYGDPLDEEIRANASPVSKTRIENQVRGRIGFDTGLLSEPGGFSSRQFGLMIDADISRIGGTHWNFTGYWRGNLNTQNTGNSAGVTPVTFNDLVNRTYHLGLYYQNPDSIIT
ncbi:MAG TPA: hypothetical protein VHS29_07585, partial [Candidatus Acidoferrales bacterium]|nr:hypothetical protein [Candidatus Acidoferrales bacterium]